MRKPKPYIPRAGSTAALVLDELKHSPLTVPEIRAALGDQRAPAKSVHASLEPAIAAGWILASPSVRGQLRVYKLGPNATEDRLPATDETKAAIAEPKPAPVKPSEAAVRAANPFGLARPEASR